MATGNLPPVAKNGLQNGSKDLSTTASTGNLIDSFTRGSDLTATSPGIGDGCKLEVVGKDNTEIAILSQCVGVSTSCPQQESADYEDIRYEELSSQVNSIEIDPESAVKLDQCRTHSENVKYEVPQGSLHSPVPEYGPLYYEPPQLESFVPLYPDVQSICWVQYDSNSSLTLSPVAFFTPPRVRADELFTQTPESILKIAAKSFPHTPSILRKRKTETQSSTSSNKVEKVGNRSSSFQRSCHESPCDDKLNDSKTFNASPPYRLRSKRTTIFKSVEKQLEFSFNREQSKNISKPGSSTIMDISPNKNNLQTSKMGVT